jgi:hypothetical protein
MMGRRGWLWVGFVAIGLLLAWLGWQALALRRVSCQSAAEIVVGPVVDPLAGLPPTTRGACQLVRVELRPWGVVGVEPMACQASTTFEACRRLPREMADTWSE